MAGSTHEVKVCPRCGLQFECKQGEINQCQCYGISFTTEALTEIGEYKDCLCRACLEALNTGGRPRENSSS